MAKEICISTTPHETRLAIVEDDQLTEIYYERENEYTLAGSIYKGKVTRVLPGMQSAFVELGLERDAFLYVTDFLEEQEDSEEFADGQQADSRKAPPEGGRGGGRRGGAPRSPERGLERNQERPAVAAVPRTEPVGSAAAEAEGEPGEEAGQGGEFQQGTRRWRGRRGRRRGVRGAQGQDADSQVSEQPEPIEEYGHTGSLSIDAKADTFAAGSAAESPTEQGRRGGRPERAGSRPGSPAITLPGEALQKYGQQPVSSEGIEISEGEEPTAHLPEVTVRPSTLVEHPIVWDGVSAALPGETLSRYRERPAPRSEVESGGAEQGYAPEHTPELQASASETAPIDSAFPPAHEEEPGPLVLEEQEELDNPSLNANAQEEAEFDPQNASASHRVDPSSPSEFRLSSLFGRESDTVEK